MIHDALKILVSGRALNAQQMRSVMTEIMQGEVTHAQLGSFLTALRMKGETVEEVLSAVKTVRSRLIPVHVEAEPLIDCCGTGGNGANVFNISTAAAFVTAAAGAKVAKHGSRSMSSRSGSADVLEVAGVALGLSPQVIAEGICSIGLGFMFAPAHHSALKHTAVPRKELGMRTLFNLVGPLVNPASVKRQVIGAFEPRLCRLIIEVLQQLGSERVLVVHAEDGLDEFSLATKTFVCELNQGVITEYSVAPEDVGLTTQSLEGLSIDNATESWALIHAALSGQAGAQFDKARDIIALNAGAAIYAADLTQDLVQGVKRAQELIRSGAALDKVHALIEFSQKSG